MLSNEWWKNRSCESCHGFPPAIGPTDRLHCTWLGTATRLLVVTRRIWLLSFLSREQDRRCRGASSPSKTNLQTLECRTHIALPAGISAPSPRFQRHRWCSTHHVAIDGLGQVPEVVHPGSTSPTSSSAFVRLPPVRRSRTGQGGLP